MIDEADPISSSLRRELQKSEAVRFQSRRARLAEERTSTEFDPTIVGSLSLKHGIWWIALYQELDGARDFLEAARFHLTRAVHDCEPSRHHDARQTYDCFDNQIGVFLATELINPSTGANLAWLDRGLTFLDRAWEQSPVDEDVAGRTPLHLFATALLALAALHQRPLPPLLNEQLRALSVRRHFQPLQDALIAAIDDPAPTQSVSVLNAYRRSVRLSEYRAALVRGLRMAALLAISAVAHHGDVVGGAVHIFE